MTAENTIFPGVADLSTQNVMTATAGNTQVSKKSTLPRTISSDKKYPDPYTETKIGIVTNAMRSASIRVAPTRTQNPA